MTSSAVDVGVDIDREPGVDAADRPRWHTVVAVVVTIVALSPVVAVLVTRAGRDYLPIQDVAVIDLRVRDVFSTDAPLVGPYSRYGWNHPGPLMYAVPALIGAPFGHPAWATLVGGALLQGIAIVWLAIVGWRLRGVLLTLLALGGLALSYSAMGEWIFLEPWNPHVAFPFFALFLLQVWAIGERHVGHVLGATITATFLVQTHVGYLPFVAVGAAYAAGCLLAQRSALDVRAMRKYVLTSLGIAAVLWIPPLLEQILRRPGNLRRLASFFLGGDAPASVGWHRAGELLAVEFRPPFPWLGSSDPVDPLFGWAGGASVGWLVVPLVLLGVSGIVAWRTRSPRAIRLVALATLVAATGLVALSRVTDLPDRYLFFWRVEVAVLVVVVTGAVVVGALRDPLRRRVRLVGGGLLAGAVAWGFGGLAIDVVDHPSAVMAQEPQAQEIVDQLETPEAAVIVRFAGDPFRGVQGAVVDELDRRGAPVFVDEELDYQFGSHRALAVAEAEEVWYVVEQGQYATLLEELPGAAVIARISPLSDADERELRALELEIADALLAAGMEEELGTLDRPLAPLLLGEVPGLPPATVERVAELNEKTGGVCRCAVIAFPADQAPPFDPSGGVSSASGLPLETHHRVQPH